MNPAVSKPDTGPGDEVVDRPRDEHFARFAKESKAHKGAILSFVGFLIVLAILI